MMILRVAPSSFANRTRQISLTCILNDVSIDWFQGKNTGKSHMSWESLWCLVDFPWSQPIESRIYPAKKTGVSNLLRRNKTYQSIKGMPDIFRMPISGYKPDTSALGTIPEAWIHSLYSLYKVVPPSYKLVYNPI